MSVNLVKGQKINLSKEVAGGLTKIMVGLGWDAVKKGFFSSKPNIDCDASAIILGKDFGQDKDLFKYYFMNYEGNEEQDSDKYEKGRNILYVAITRAIKNLRVLYIDDFEEIKDGIEKVFEKAYAFTNEISIDDF